MITPIFLHSFDNQGQLVFFKEIPNYTPRLIGSNGNIFGTTGNSDREIISSDSQGNEIWRYNQAPSQNYFVFPFALTKDGTLYSLTSQSIYAFGQ